MQGENAPDRILWRVTGADRVKFLQGMVSNDLLPLEKAAGIRYAALLTPQGKYLADFFIIRRESDDDALLIDIKQSLAADTLKRLTMYRLRADVQISPCDLHVSRGLGPAPAGAFEDPRHPSLGWRLYGPEQGGTPAIDWDAIRVAHCIPESGIELVINDSYLLETGFERLNGVDFRKGCYVGQEVTARMKHKTELRKGLIGVTIDGEAEVGTPIVMADGREAGQIFTQSGGKAIAYLRFDRKDGLSAQGAAVTVEG